MSRGAGVLVGVFALVGALALGVVPPASAAPSPPPGGPSEVASVVDLPDCSTLSDDQVGLGWSGTWDFGYLGGNGSQYEVAFVMPCQRTAGRYARTYMRIEYLGGGSNVVQNTTYYVRSQTDCVRPDGSEFVITFEYYWHPNNGTQLGGGAVSKLGTLADTGGSLNDVLPATAELECRGVRSVRVLWQAVDWTTTPTRLLPLYSATWRASDWRFGSSGWSPAQSFADIDGAAGIELPIVCQIDNSGNDLFEIVGNVVASMATWPGCMLIPRGWDRSGQIDAAWARSPGAAVLGALEDSLPNGLACGQVMSMTFYSVPVVLDTCDVTFVPALVKTTIAAVIVLGLAVLIWLRILWSLGSG